MLETLLTVWMLHAVLMITPGPNTLLISQLAASSRDRRTAQWAALGIVVGTAMWAVLAVMGVGAVFTVLPGLRLGMQAVAGVYLLYLASRLWRSGTAPVTGTHITVAALGAFRMGALTNVTNPKGALFFSSVFLAVFPAQPSVGLRAAAILVVVLNSLCWHQFLAWAFSLGKVQTVYNRQRLWINRVAGGLIGAMGAKLVAVTWAEART